MPPLSFRAEVNKCITESVKLHPWLYDLCVNGVMPDTEEVGIDGALNGIFAMLGGIVNALDLLAKELEKQDASR